MRSRRGLVFLFGVFGVALLVSAQVPSGTKSQTASPASAPKTAEQVYKDIQVFKGVPADKIMPTMQFMNIALGVNCEHCHLPGVYEAANANKNMARTMIKMQYDVIKGPLDDVPALTCWTCHRGSIIPPTTPPLATNLTPVEAHEPEPPPAIRVTTTPEQVLAKWVQAAGGSDVLNKVSSQMESGTISVGEMKWPVQVLTKAPRRRMSITHAPDGQSITAFDGEAGWLGTVGRAAHDMSPEEDYSAMLDAAVAFPATAQKAFSRMRMWRPEVINGRGTNVVLGSNVGHPDVTLYFDKETGLLLRMDRHVDTPIGQIPTQVNYEDYRSEGGVKMPFRWSIARPQGKFVIQIERVQQNIALDDSRFTKPQGVVPANLGQTVQR